MNRLTRTCVAIGCVLSLLLCVDSVIAGKPKKPGGNVGDPGPFTLVDLLGVPNLSPDGTVSYLSSASSVSEPDLLGNVFVGGFSHLHPEESNHAVQWDVSKQGAFVVTDLGLPAGAEDSAVVDTNDLGDFAIQSWGPTDGGHVLVMGQSLRSVADDAELKSINNVGQIVGVREVNGYRIGYLWEVDPHGDVASAEPLPDFLPNDINDSGVMVGESKGRAAIAQFQNSQLEITYLTSDYNSYATAISDSGEWVVGQSSFFNGNHWSGEAFVWNSDLDGLTGLGTIEGYGSSCATAVNDFGQIVGWSDVHGKIGQAAFLYDPNDGGQMRDVNQIVNAPSGFTLRYAYDINNAGHIVGEHVKSSKSVEWRAYLLIPNQQ